MRTTAFALHTEQNRPQFTIKLRKTLIDAASEKSLMFNLVFTLNHYYHTHPHDAILQNNKKVNYNATHTHTHTVCR